MKSYVVMWNQENNMGIPLIPKDSSAIRVLAEDQDDAIEKACICLLEKLPKQFDYMSCTIAYNEDNKLEITIQNDKEEDFHGRLFEFVALTAE